MRVEKTSLPGVLLITPPVHRDARGFFIETYHEQRYREAGVEAHFVQDNLSLSTKGVLRGLHAQLKRPQAKLVRCAEGRVWDVVADIRVGSPSFAQWYGVELDAESGRQLYVPVGFVHGFCVLSERAIIEYKCSDIYVADDQLSVRWNDPDLGIAWPVHDPILSEKDRRAPGLAELMHLLPRWRD
jgi:dTDP-4-dehydrorhamnose 3,5-epimerase